MPTTCTDAAIRAAFTGASTTPLSVTLYNAQTISLDISDNTEGVNSSGDIDYDTDLTVGANPNEDANESLIHNGEKLSQHHHDAFIGPWFIFDAILFQSIHK